jgi:shikimate kinase
VTPVVVLVGPPGAGKSTVGALLADRLGVPLRDTDEDVESGAGKSVADIFVDDGEQQFRELEVQSVTAALVEHDGVVSLGGGAVLAASTRKLLAGHRVVFLDVGLAEAAARVGLGSARPLLLGNVRAQLKALLDERRPLYREVADVVIDTNRQTPEEVADQLIRELDR